MIDDYTSEDTTTIQLVITADNKISANIKGQSISKTLLTKELQEELDNKVNNTDIATTSSAGLVYATNSINYGITLNNNGMLSLYKTSSETLKNAILSKQRSIPIISCNFIESINSVTDSKMLDESENLVSNGVIKQYVDSKDIKYVTTTETTKTINPNTFYDFGIVETLNITLAEITDTTIINEYMFQFETGTLATELTFTDTIKWIQNPTILPDKTYQVSIINNIGIMLEV